MAEKVTYGIKNVYASKITRSDSGIVAYGTPKVLPYASEISLSIVGDMVKKYADNINFFKTSVNQGYDGSLSLYSVPDWFAQDFLGYTIDGNGVLVEDSNAVLSDFALLFEFNTDTAKTKRNVLYNVTASRPEISAATREESIDPQPLSIPISAAPATDTEYVKASTLGDSSDSAWSSWFSSVFTPAVATQYKVTVSVSNGTTAIADALVVCGGKIAITDASGNASFMLVNGTYDVLVSATGYTAQASTVTVASAAATKSITMVAA